MRCEELQRHLADHLSGTLPAGTADAVASHLQSCGRCAAEAAALADTWQALADLLIVPADTGGMRARFAMMLEQHHEQARARPSSTSSSSRWQWSAPAAAWAGAAAAILLLGVALGQQTAAAPPIDPQMAALREELRDMRELMTLTLLQQQSASDRLTGVAWTRQLDHPGDTIAAALVEVLTRDPNVNVRIAAVDALGRLADSDTVRRGAIDALPQEPSPLVQVALIDLLVQVNGREAADALRRLSSDPVVDSAVRARAAQGLAQVGT